MTTTAKTTVVMDARGQITLPDDVRHVLQIENDHGMLLELEVVDGTLVLRPGLSIPEEDLWAYTPENTKLLLQARDRPRDEDLRLTHAELERLVLGTSE